MGRRRTGHDILLGFLSRRFTLSFRSGWRARPVLGVGCPVSSRLRIFGANTGFAEFCVLAFIFKRRGWNFLSALLTPPQASQLENPIDALRSS